MSAIIIDGKKISRDIRHELENQIADLRREGLIPGLATVLIGNNAASVSYVRMKKKACQDLSIYNECIERDASISEKELLSIIDGLKRDSKIHGILVQLPLPDHINEKSIFDAIPPEKDVDGFSPVNLGKMMLGEDCFLSCTPAGIQELLIRSGFPPDGKHVVVLGRSHLVGLPLANILMKKAKGANATVTVCHTGTKNISDYTRQADILVAAMGKPEFITADMVKDDAVIVDVGTNRVEAPETERGYRIVGDVKFEEVAEKVRAISPVPGGVGPMTITMLLQNTVKSAILSLTRQ
ncbi:bifunctional 5,10-methylene-tetrahydrofolate dehydrogenase/5,10-methylene-tetrahydrofolate cyclohydrolase [candidate division KSB1 bacterium]|nr:bifunctional 5,10-methylene-tetrahydrofolate dehydrogenase/5,10-methylene-tetrahydrofolate cyclohydrolase [candidate division KSB1 bacterium]